MNILYMIRCKNNVLAQLRFCQGRIVANFIVNFCLVCSYDSRNNDNSIRSQSQNSIPVIPRKKAFHITVLEIFNELRTSNFFHVQSQTITKFEGEQLISDSVVYQNNLILR